MWGGGRKGGGRSGGGGWGCAVVGSAAPMCTHAHARARTHTHTNKQTNTHTAVDWAILSNDDAPAEQVGAAAARIGAELARRAAAAVGSANTAGSAS